MNVNGNNLPEMAKLWKHTPCQNSICFAHFLFWMFTYILRQFHRTFTGFTCILLF